VSEALVPERAEGIAVEDVDDQRTVGCVEIRIEDGIRRGGFRRNTRANGVN
jgi:hypothetical protein